MYVETNSVIKARKQYEESGGIWQGGYTGYELAFYYCNGMTIPLEPQLFFDLVNISYIYDTLYDNSNYTSKQLHCVYHTYGIPLISQIYNNFIDYINNNNDSKLINVYSVHGTTLMYLLESFNIWDRLPFSNAEMITLEIYLANNNITTVDHHFGFTRKGQFVRYP